MLTKEQIKETRDVILKDKSNLKQMLLLFDFLLVNLVVDDRVKLKRKMSWCTIVFKL
jgi:hypothetical protein